MSAAKTTSYELARRLQETLRQQEEEDRQQREAEEKARRRREKEEEARQRREAEEEAKRRREEERLAAERLRLEKLRRANEEAQSVRAGFSEIIRGIQDFVERHPGEIGEIPIPSLPADPDPTSQSDLERYVAEVTQIRTAIESRLRQVNVNAQFKKALSGLAELALAPPRTAADMLASLAQQQTNLQVADNVIKRTEVRKAEADKLTVRIRTLGVELVSDDLRRLLEELLTTESDARADSLGTEIRLRIQQLNEDIVSRAQERTDAAALLEQLNEAKGYWQRKLHEQLTLVATGVARLTKELHMRVQEEIAAQNKLREKAKEEQKRKEEQEVTAQILNGVLSDLGYAVEPITHTLFVSGGQIHIRQPGWDENYFVRLRVLPDKKMINFNMVRVNDGLATDSESSKRRDAKMENAWCSAPDTGFQKIKQVANDRGLLLGSLREIAPGQLPVQLVTSDEIPANLRKPSKAQSPDAELKQTRN